MILECSPEFLGKLTLELSNYKFGRAGILGPIEKNLNLERHWRWMKRLRKRSKK